MIRRRSRPEMFGAASESQSGQADDGTDPIRHEAGEHRRAVADLTEVDRARYDEPPTYADIHGGVA